jgi:hypothetical protein
VKTPTGKNTYAEAAGKNVNHTAVEQLRIIIIIYFQFILVKVYPTFIVKMSLQWRSVT